MEYEKQLGYSVPTTKKPEPVFTPAQQAHQWKIFQGYAQDREAAPTREREQQRQAVPGRVQPASLRPAQHTPSGNGGRSLQSSRPLNSGDTTTWLCSARRTN